MTVYQYDINSAYARTYRDLPCLVHGMWEPITTLPDDGIYVAEVVFEHPRTLKLGTLPIRTKVGSIIFPRSGGGVYFSPELNIARKYGVKLTVLRGYRYVSGCGCTNLTFIDALYRKRRELGKDGRGRVLKLTLASTYGKLVQSVGSAPYANPVWGSLITSTVRAQLIDAALLPGNGGADVCMLATDGLFCTEPRDLDIGSGLGQWTCTEHTDMFIVQSGVYFLPGEKPKTRGVPQAKIVEAEPRFREVWDQYINGGPLEPVKIYLNNFIGIRLALARNKPEIAGQWLKSPKKIRFDFISKRSNPRKVGKRVITDILPGSYSLESVPYPRVIGGHLAKDAFLEYVDTELLEVYEERNRLRAGERDQPDWGDVLSDE